MRREGPASGSADDTPRHDAFVSHHQPVDSPGRYSAQPLHGTTGLRRLARRGRGRRVTDDEGGRDPEGLGWRYIAADEPQQDLTGSLYQPEAALTRDGQRRLDPLRDGRIVVADDR